MRFGVNRIFSMLAGLFASAPAPRRSQVTARAEMRRLALAEPVKSGRSKCGGPNWLKISMCGQKQRRIRA